MAQRRLNFDFRINFQVAQAAGAYPRLNEILNLWLIARTKYNIWWQCMADSPMQSETHSRMNQFWRKYFMLE